MRMQRAEKSIPDYGVEAVIVTVCPMVLIVVSGFVENIAKGALRNKAWHDFVPEMAVHIIAK